MAEVVGTVASVVGLVDAAFTLIQKIREARDRVRGASKTLDDTSQQLAELERSLELVKEEGALQTAAIEQQLTAIAGVAEELRSFFDRLERQQQRKTIAQFTHALKAGDKDDTELQGILDRLDRARDGLVVRILVAQVGLVGNLQDGFRVAFGVLTETNERVRQVLGTNLALMDRLGPRAARQTVNGMLPLDAADADELGLGARAATREATAGTDETSIYDNVTLGQARIMTGNVGVEDWRRVAGRKTTIAHNRFGNDVRIMTGNMGGPAAAAFNENFWS